MTAEFNIFTAISRCRRCGGRNVVDARKALARRSRCGRCGEPLPIPFPAPLVVAAGMVAIAALAGVYFAVGAWHSRASTASNDEMRRLLAEGHAAEAAALLPEHRTASSEEGELGRQIAAALAAPIVEADRDASLGRAALDQAVDRADDLMRRWCAGRPTSASTQAEAREPAGSRPRQDPDDDDCLMPELMPLLDVPVRRLQARLGARDLLAGAERLASSDDPSLDAVERALADARLRSVDAPPGVEAALDDYSQQIRCRAALLHARRVVAKHPDEARGALAKAAAPVVLPPIEAAAIDAEPPSDVAAKPLLDQLAAVRTAIVARDAAALRGLVLLRPGGGWTASAGEELDREVARACVALASLETDAARASMTPDDRAQHLIAAMTCDETLPRDFMLGARMALADAFADRARRGGDARDALAAWASIDRPERDRALAAIGCLAEARGDWASAAKAWALVESRKTLGLLEDCRLEAKEPPAPLAVPALDYPSVAANG